MPLLTPEIDKPPQTSEINISESLFNSTDNYCERTLRTSPRSTQKVLFPNAQRLEIALLQHAYGDFYPRMALSGRDQSYDITYKAKKQ